MPNKKIIIVIALAFVVVAAAAFVGGRMLTNQAGSLGLIPAGPDGRISVRIQRTPAPELPAATPELTGLFISRENNTILLQSMNGMKVKVVKQNDEVSVSPADGSDEGPKVEVVITGQTKIWRDTTQISGPPGSGEVGVQQTVEDGTLDDLNQQSMLMVWGRKNGDRIIADAISYSNPVIFDKP